MSKQKKYNIHPDFEKFPCLPIPFNRPMLAFINGVLMKFDVYSQQRERMAKSKKHHVVSADGYSIPVLQFNPDNTGANEKLPAIIYFHGGAFVFSYAGLHVASADIYAQQAHCTVFLVDYRLAPKYPFPKGFEDCYAVLQWVADNTKTLGINASRIAVMGDSAGGAFAAGVAQRALDEKGPAICAQSLIYPVIDKSSGTKSAKQFIDTPLWNGKLNRKMWEVYLRNFSDQAGISKNVPPYAAPADRKDLRGLPPAYVETAEFDPLRDEGIAYAKQLEAAGIKVILNETQGTIHGYDVADKSEVTQQSMQKRIHFLKTAFQ